jgi:hypothetical protein
LKRGHSTFEEILTFSWVFSRCGCWTFSTEVQFTVSWNQSCALFDPSSKPLIALKSWANRDISWNCINQDSQKFRRYRQPFRGLKTSV